MRFGAAFWIQRTGWPDLRDACLAVEDAGWDSLWLDDHLLSDEAIHDIYEARQIVEVGAARLAATRARPEDLDALDRIIGSMERALPQDEKFWPLTVGGKGRPARLGRSRAFWLPSRPSRIVAPVHARG